MKAYATLALVAIWACIALRCCLAQDFARNEDTPNGKRTMLADPIVTKYKMGDTLMGHGVAPWSNMASPKATTLAYVGPTDQPIITLNGSGARVGMFGLSGCHPKTTDYAKIGLLITKPANLKGIGSGKHTIGPLYIDGCETAVQLGATKGTHNSDECVFLKLEVGRSEVGVKNVAAMSMGHVFTHFLSRCSKHAVVVNGGGNLVFTKLVQTMPCESVIRIESKNGGIGSNNGYYDFGSVHLDSQVGKAPVLEHVTDEDIDVTFTSIVTKYDHYDGTPKLVIRGGDTVAVMSFPTLQAGGIVWHSKSGETAKITILSTRIEPIAALNVDESTGWIDARIGGERFMVRGAK